MKFLVVIVFAMCAMKVLNAEEAELDVDKRLGGLLGGSGGGGLLGTGLLGGGGTPGGSTGGTTFLGGVSGSTAVNPGNPVSGLLSGLLQAVANLLGPLLKNLGVGGPGLLTNLLNSLGLGAVSG